MKEETNLSKWAQKSGRGLNRAPRYLLFHPILSICILLALIATNLSRACGTGCHACSPHLNCTVCLPGYRYNAGACEKCQTRHCQSCTTNVLTCEICLSGFTRGTDVLRPEIPGCIKCVSGCESCDNNRRCQKCNFFYTLNEKKTCDTDVVIVILALAGVLGLSLLCFLAFYQYRLLKSRRKKKELAERKGPDKRRAEDIEEQENSRNMILERIDDLNRIQRPKIHETAVLRAISENPNFKPPPPDTRQPGAPRARAVQRDYIDSVPVEFEYSTEPRPVTNFKPIPDDFEPEQTYSKQYIDFRMQKKVVKDHIEVDPARFRMPVDQVNYLQNEVFAGDIRNKDYLPEVPERSPDS